MNSPKPPPALERNGGRSPNRKPPMRFRTAKQSRVFQDVVNQIQEAILRRELRPGDTLPAEREMKEMFGTSRGTLREALRVLEQKGLIEIRLGAGGGAVIRDSPAAPFSESLDLLIRFRKISLDHLAEFREGVEGAVAALAAEKAGREDMETLSTLLAEAEALAVEGPAAWDRFLEVDKTIHQALARIAGNPLYILVHQMVHENIHRYYEDYLAAEDERMTRNAEDLKAIVAAVREGRAEAARAAARDHVRRFGVYMRRADSMNRGEPTAMDIFRADSLDPGNGRK
jgi:DNA-binding FadR family transcriptional regulator